MTSFVNDSGEYLEYNGPDITLNKQAVSFFGFQIKGDFSQNFTIDNNSNNRSVLGYYSAMQVSNPAFSKNTFTLVRNGNRIMRGFVVITDININSIDCFFLAGNSSWFNALSENLKNMDWEEFTTVWGQNPAVTTGIIFPIVDWGYNGLRRGGATSIYIFTERVGFTGLVPVDKLSDNYPCMRLYRIVEKISKETGVKITGNLLDDPVYLALTITPNGPDLKWPTTQTEPYRNLAERSGVAQTLNDNDTLIFNSIITQGAAANYDTTTGIYTARLTATYKITLNLLMASADSYEFYLYKNGATETIVFVDSLGSFDNYSGTFYLNLAKGDYFELKIRSMAAPNDLSTGSDMLVEISEKIEPVSYFSNDIGFGNQVTNYVSASAIVPNMKAIDLIKFLTNYFNCVCTYDLEENQMTLTKLNTITETEDWSEYYQSHEEGYNRSIATNNYINFLPSSEVDIVRYNEVNDVKFGGGNIITDYSVKRDNTLYTIPFGAAYDQLNKTKLGGTLPYIEFFRLSDSQDASIEYSSVTDSAGAAQFNHAGNSDANNRRVYRIVSNSGIYSGYAVNNSGIGGSPIYSTFFGVNYISTDTGRIIAQEAQRISGPHRLLYVESDSTAFFDSAEISLAINNIDGRNSNTIGELYHQKLKNGFNSPVIPARMILPEAVYQRFNFDKFVRVRANNLDGLFYVNKISSYKNSKSECLVELIFM